MVSLMEGVAVFVACSNLTAHRAVIVAGTPGLGRSVNCWLGVTE